MMTRCRIGIDKSSRIHRLCFLADADTVHSPTSCRIFTRIWGETLLKSRCRAKRHGKELINQSALDYLS